MTPIFSNKEAKHIMRDGIRYYFAGNNGLCNVYEPDTLHYLCEISQSLLDGLKAIFKEMWGTRYLTIDFADGRRALWTLADNSDFEEGKEVDPKSIAYYDSDRKWTAKAKLPE